MSRGCPCFPGSLTSRPDPFLAHTHELALADWHYGRSERV